MVDGRTIVHLYGPHYAVLDVALAWHRAGRPPINSAGRLKPEQQRAWDLAQRGLGSPADNPNDTVNYELAHVRFCALDIDPTPARVEALEDEGLVRPFDYEGWHWRPVDFRWYPLVDFIPDDTPSLDSLLAPASVPVPIPTLPKMGKKMSTLYYRTHDNTRTPAHADEWALAGDGVGSAAWLPIADGTLANNLAALTISGQAVWLSHDTYAAWREAYLSDQPVELTPATNVPDAQTTPNAPGKA